MGSSENSSGSAGSVIIKFFAALVFIAQAAASGILFFKAFSLRIVPDKYLIALGIMLWLLMMVSALLLFVGLKRIFSAAGIAKRIIAVMLAAFICFVSMVGYKGMDGVKKTISEVAATEQTDAAEATLAMMNLYVTYSDPAKSASDCKNYVIWSYHIKM